MKKHLVHYLLILMLAIAPMQSVLAGLAALEHASACEMGAMTGDEHAGMDHASMDHDMSKTDAQCECCSDCMSVCVSVSQVSYLGGAQVFKPLVTSLVGQFDYQLAASSQHPPTDIRPPIVLH